MTRERALEAALRAINARIAGEFDQPDLMAFGPLSPSSENDCADIARAALALPPDPPSVNADMLAALQSIHAKAEEIFERLAACQGKGRPSTGIRDVCLHKAQGIVSNARAAIARATGKKD